MHYLTFILLSALHFVLSINFVVASENESLLERYGVKKLYMSLTAPLSFEELAAPINQKFFSLSFQELTTVNFSFRLMHDSDPDALIAAGLPLQLKSQFEQNLQYHKEGQINPWIIEEKKSKNVIGVAGLMLPDKKVNYTFDPQVAWLLALIPKDRTVEVLSHIMSLAFFKLHFSVIKILCGLEEKDLSSSQCSFSEFGFVKTNDIVSSRVILEATKDSWLQSLKK